VKWRTTHSDPRNVINEDQVIIDNKGGTEDQMDSNNQGIRTSTRPKRFQNTRSDDFLSGIRLNRAIYDSPTFMVLKHQRYTKHSYL
jgi:hypothetical protein